MAEEESFKVVDRRHRDTEATTETESRSTPQGQRATGTAHPSTISPPSSGEADPATGERQVDLAQAREAVDLLLLLRDKTEGNRTEQETRFLEDVLHDLEMRFVRAAAASGR